MILHFDPSSRRCGGGSRAAPGPVAEMLALHRLGEPVLDEEILVGDHSMNEVSDE
ncbi:MAG: hypothetical protein ACYDHX_03060 [Methanothrix sp.]